MSDLKNKANLSALPKSGNVIVGFSGGADSMALTHFLSNEIDKSRIICAHVNHMLRGDEADRDELAAKLFCEDLGVRFVVLKKDVKTTAEMLRQSTEECGRNVRYAFFESLIESENDRILTAHNADDNAETVIFNLAKGTGIKGLSGIPYERDRIIRPLLAVSRNCIEEYCKENELDYVNDSTNFGDDYARNRIRHHIIPLMKELNSGFLESVSQMTLLLKQDKDYIENQAKELIKSSNDNEYGLKLEELKKADKAVLSAALKLYFEVNGSCRLEYKHINTAIENLQNGKGMTLPGDIEMNCSAGYLTLSKKKEYMKVDWDIEILLYCINFSENTIYKKLLPNGKTLIFEKIPPFKLKNKDDNVKINNLLFKSCIDYDTIKNILTIRTRRHGDKITPAGRGVRKTLKNLLSEARVPASKRDDIVVLETDGEPVFVEKVGVEDKFSVTSETKNVVRIEIV